VARPEQALRDGKPARPGRRTLDIVALAEDGDLRLTLVEDLKLFNGQFLQTPSGSDQRPAKLDDTRALP
jgi:hypothetical protein